MQNALSMTLSCGILITSMHGAFVNDNSNLNPVDFTSKVIKDLHTHNDHPLQAKHIIADTRSLRHIRYDGGKTAQNDRMRSGWDFYDV